MLIRVVGVVISKQMGSVGESSHPTADSEGTETSRMANTIYLYQNSWFIELFLTKLILFIRVTVPFKIELL